MRRFLLVGLALALALPSAAQTPSPPTDADLARGIQQVEEGDYDAAILTLDNAARRLAMQPARSRELSQAYLYLGVAYVGKGHEAAAKSKFREAVTQLRELTLSPDKFPPKVIDLFEAARAEVAAAPVARQEPAPEARKKGGGGKKALLIGGLGAAAAGGAVLALKKNEESFCDTASAFRSGPLSLPNDSSVDLVAGPAIEPGVWAAELSWTGGPPGTDVLLKALDGSGSVILEGGVIGTGRRKAEWNGQPGVAYTARAILVSGGPVSFELSIDGPCVNTP